MGSENYLTSGKIDQSVPYQYQAMWRDLKPLCLQIVRLQRSTPLEKYTPYIKEICANPKNAMSTYQRYFPEQRQLFQSVLQILDRHGLLSAEYKAALHSHGFQV